MTIDLEQLPAQGQVGKASRSGLVLASVALLSLLFDGLLIAIGLRGLLPTLLLIVLHLGLAPVIWLMTRNCEPATSALAVVSVLVLGPVGGLGMLFMARATARANNDDQDPLAEWHDRLAKPVEVDLPQRLTQAINEGRLLPPGHAVPMSFADISRYGSTQQRQAMLGLISQHFDPGFSLVLRQELVSQEAAVRVSAAAVFSKLRDRNRQLMGAGGPVPDILPPGEAEKRGMALARGVRSGLLDPADLVATRIRSIELLLVARPQATKADGVEETIASLLYDAGRFDLLDERLSTLDLDNSRILHDLYARVLMRSGRSSDSASVMRSRRDGTSRPNIGRRGGSPLLSSRTGVVR